jgi:hypothetical protein
MRKAAALLLFPFCRNPPTWRDRSGSYAMFAASGAFSRHQGRQADCTPPCGIRYGTSFRRSCGIPVESGEPDADTGCPLRAAEHTIYLRNGGELTGSPVILRVGRSGLPVRCRCQSCDGLAQSPSSNRNWSAGMYEALRDEGRWALPEVLAFQARTRPDDTFVIWSATGETLSYAKAASEADRVAGMFAVMGVGHGDAVAVMLPNGLDFVRAWLGLMRLGATAVLLNPELRGAFLEHQLKNAGCRVVLTDASLRDRIAEVAADVPKLATLILTDRREGAVNFTQWRTAAPYTGPMPLARDIACIMYTSGTTGPAKGVLMPHAHCYLMGLGIIDNQRLTANDRYFVLPLFHANGLLLQLGATLIAGGSAVLRERFSASAWLQDVRRFNATVTNMLGVVAAFAVV